MKNLTVTLLVLAGLLGLAGCSGVGEGPGGGHDVSWYLHHQNQMQKESHWCKESADRSKLTSCKNVKEAESQALSYNAKKTVQSVKNDL